MAIKFVVLIGVSGAGKVEASKGLNDMGFFCVDNIPLSLIPEFATLYRDNKAKMPCVSMGIDIREDRLIDIRGAGFSKAFFSTLSKISRLGIEHKIIFLDASDVILERRFKETGRPHPFGKGDLLDNIRRERKHLEEIRKKADLVVDTSELTPQELRRLLKMWITKPQWSTISTIEKEGIFLDKRREKNTELFPYYWEQLKLNKTSPKMASEFLSLLTNLTGLKIKERLSSDREVCFKIDITSLRIRMEEALFILSYNQKESPLRRVESIQKNRDGYNRLSFLITLNGSEELNRQKEDIPLVILDEDRLKNIFYAYNPKKELIHSAIESAGLSFLSPYNSVGLAKTTFYGREEEIKEILRSRNNYALVGGRRIGKTSLLFRLIKEMEEKGNIRPIFIDCSTFDQYPDFFSEVGYRFGQEIKGFSDLSRYIRKSYESDQKMFVFFLDEVDRLLNIEKKNGYGLLSLLRELANYGASKCIMAGFKELYYQTKSMDSPLYNLVKVIRLFFLDKSSAEMLIREPLENLGIRFEDSIKDINHILKLTSCYPCYINLFCEGLINDMAKGKGYLVSGDLISDVYRKSMIEEMLIKEFEANLDRTEQIIALESAETKSFWFKPEEIYKRVREKLGIRMDQFTEALDNLVLTNTFIKDKGFYSFSFGRFPAILKKDIESRRRDLVKEVINERIADIQK
ncbi:MAG: RNase adapter RapZ [bacterium]